MMIVSSSLGLFYLLGDEGDACLIPAPYYAAFESDLRIVARIVPFAVHMANPARGPSASELDLAFIEAKSVSFLFPFVFGRDHGCNCIASRESKKHATMPWLCVCSCLYKCSCDPPPTVPTLIFALLN